MTKEEILASATEDQQVSSEVGMGKIDVVFGEFCGDFTRTDIEDVYDELVPALGEEKATRLLLKAVMAVRCEFTGEGWE